MKILYGVTGEGMGHAMRSRVIMEHLIRRGHSIEIMASGRAAAYLAKQFDGVNTIHGLHLILEDNRVRPAKTLLSNMLSGALGIPKNIAAYFELIAQFQPEVVISDFESWTYLYGQNHRLPLLSIDNMQIINRCTLMPGVIDDNRMAYELTKAFIKTKLPGCDAYFITTFFKVPVRKPDTYLFPPVLRPEILAAKPGDGEHILVYQSGANPALQAALARTGIESRIYGMRPGLTAEERVDNLRFMPFSEAGFITDLATCRLVIAGGGFTLMGEALYLKRPMLALPIEGQFEQMLNARYLQHEGFGMWAPNLDDDKLLPSVLERLPSYVEALATYHQNGNDELLGAVDEFLERAATEPR